MGSVLKKLIVVAVVGLAGVGVGAALGYGPLLRYKSAGVLSMDMSTAEYKRFSELATDASTVRQFIAMSSPEGGGKDTHWTDKFVNYVTEGRWLTPVPKFSKGDAKDLPEGLLQPDKLQRVYLGVTVAYTAAEPADAAQGAALLGRYFKDVATQEAVRQLVFGWAATTRQFADRAAAQKLDYQFKIDQAKTRAVALKKLVASYPQSTRSESRQVVDVRPDNARFMSPLAQLIGAESETINVQQQVQKLDRDMEKQAFAKAIVADAVTALQGARGGSDGVVRLTQVLDRSSKLAKTDAQREELASLAADVSQISARFLSQAQFIATPSVPSRPARPTPLMVMVLVGFLAAALSAAVVWRDALKKMLLEGDEEDAPWPRRGPVAGEHPSPSLQLSPHIRSD